MMSDAKRLHPATIILNIFKTIKELLFLIVITFITADFNTFLLFLFIFLLIVVIFATLSWYRYSYSVTEEALHIEYGIFKRTKRTISKNRIQSIDLTESILHRLFKLVRVQIETASGGSKAEASLAAVTLVEGERLRKELKRLHYTENDGEIDIPDREPVAKREITFQQLLLAGMTSGGIGIILGFIGLGLSELEEIIPENVYDYTFDWLLSSTITAIIIIIIMTLFVVWLLSVGLILLRYGKFKIQMDAGELLIARGLLEKKQLTIPLNRIQAVGIEENILRQPFGYAAVVAEIAGGSSDGKDATSTVLFPIMHKREIPEFLEQFVPGFTWNPDQVSWIKPPQSALKFYLFRSGIFLFLLSIAVFFIFPSYAWIPVVLLALSLCRGWLCYRDAGFDVGEDRLYLRYRAVKRVTVILYHKRIQAFEKKQHPLQRRSNLTSMAVSILSNSSGRHYHIRDLEEHEVDHLSDLFAYKK